MKHLKVKAELQKNKKEVKLTLLEQTHYGKDFGTGMPQNANPFGWDWYGNCAFTHNECSIVSHYNDVFREGVAVPAKWFLFPLNKRGTGVREVTIPIKVWEWLKPVIEAYNEWGKDK